MFQLSSLAIYIVIPAVPICIHTQFFPLFEDKLNKAEHELNTTGKVFPLAGRTSDRGLNLDFFSIKRLLLSPEICEPCLSNEQIGLS